MPNPVVYFTDRYPSASPSAYAQTVPANLPPDQAEEDSLVWEFIQECGGILFHPLTVGTYATAAVGVTAAYWAGYTAIYIQGRWFFFSAENLARFAVKIILVFGATKAANWMATHCYGVIPGPNGQPINVNFGQAWAEIPLFYRVIFCAGALLAEGGAVALQQIQHVCTQMAGSCVLSPVGAEAGSLYYSTGPGGTRVYPRA